MILFRNKIYIFYKITDRVVLNKFILVVIITQLNKYIKLKSIFLTLLANKSSS